MRELGMEHQLTIFTVNGHKEAGTQQRDHQLQLFLRAMARNVYIRDALIEHLSSLAKQAVDRPMYHFLVARYGRGRENDRITGLDAHQAMILVSNAGQRRGRLALAAGTDDYYLLRLKFVDILGSDQHPFGNIQVAKLNRHLYVVDHAATNKRDKTLVARRRIHHLLYARDQRCKSRDENTSGGVSKDFVERIVNHALGRRIAGSLHTRAIAIISRTPSLPMRPSV